MYRCYLKYNVRNATFVGFCIPACYTGLTEIYFVSVIWGHIFNKM